jgi:CheY-like chemotaxis protein
MSATDATSSGPAAALPQRALVVDDEASLREVLVTMLEAIGVRADGVASGPEALARLEGGPYDLVITDLVMPRMTGWEVIGAIRERGLGVAVVLASGSISNLEDSRRAEELGVVVLRKPFRIGELAAAVTAAVRRAARAPAEAHVAAPPSLGGAPPAGATAPAGAPPTVVRVLQAMHRASEDLQALVAAVDVVVREQERLATQLARLEAEHKSLRQTHEMLVAAHRVDVAALAELRESQARLVRGQERAHQALVALRDQLDRAIRELGGPGEGGGPG